MQLEFNGQCPAWLFPILRILGLTIGNPWTSYEAQVISSLIEDEYYKDAERRINLMESQFGSSTETVMLRARLARFQILGKDSK